MTDYVNDYFTKNPGSLRKPLRTKRGDTLSVQASRGHYCSPRGDKGPYTAVEVWWSGNRCPRTLRPHQQKGDDGPLGWVPVADVNLWIARRGGLA